MHTFTVSLLCVVASQISPHETPRLPFDPPQALDLVTSEPIDRPTPPQPSHLPADDAAASPVSLSKSIQDTSNRVVHISPVVVQASFQKTWPDSTAEEKTLPAKRLLKHLLENTDNKTISLAAFLEQVNPQTDPLTAIQIYWLVSESVARQKLAKEQFFLLQDLQSNVALEQHLLHAAQASATAQCHKTEIDLRNAQERLSALMTKGSGHQQLLPSEFPVVSPYFTNYSILSAARVVPKSFSRIHRLLPELHQQVTLQSRSVLAARQTVLTFRDAWNLSETDCRQLLFAIDHLQTETDRFLNTVYQYNTWIARFAVRVSDSDRVQDSLAQMLVIPRPLKQSRHANVRQAAALSPLKPIQRSSQNTEPLSNAPRLLTPGWKPRSKPRELPQNPHARPISH